MYTPLPAVRTHPPHNSVLPPTYVPSAHCLHAQEVRRVTGDTWDVLPKAYDPAFKVGDGDSQGR